MHKRFVARCCALLMAASAWPAAASLHARPSPVRHVVLVSIDGLHALDLRYFIRFHPDSHLAALAAHGIEYTDAHTVVPADSFPGLLALVTGGTPAVTGVYYDNSWDRSLAPAQGPCVADGAHVLYNEHIDKPDGSGIDPARLPRDPAHGCRRVYPWQYLKVNTVFNVVHQAGGYTAWADKHPAYAIVQGPSGHGVDDLYTPEIGKDGEDQMDTDVITASIAATETYDTGKMRAVINELQGHRHGGHARAPVPTLLGLNLQSINVAQKLAGYQNAEGMPSPSLDAALGHVDSLIGELQATLVKQHLAASTLLIITAKHGNGPIDPAQITHVDKARLKAVVADAARDEPAQLTTDQVALLWLHDARNTGTVARTLLADRAQLGIQNVLWGRRLALLFPSAEHDNRAPDIVVIPHPGVIYDDASASKRAEHGGFSDDDTHVALLLSGPMLPHPGWRLRTPVSTTSVAPTLLEALGLNPDALQAVRQQFTPLLPGVAWTHLARH
ncbi:alkaline phosphatase family protein [Oleiagrimonas sp. C23AA]|uniref:alkaline phosphatase family protein n=1 Tax=Oleiagrimonas sp. C23AA TaxID=2719047 RepID=UPI00141E7E3F|nr:alkaline phosphatase family protein [Oleiagrimonas sp. C23AA]NII09683.1 alkaline phosphatase family protein [Oleiagrimonas sp. C23AA]